MVWANERGGCFQVCPAIDSNIFPAINHPLIARTGREASLPLQPWRGAVGQPGRPPAQGNRIHHPRQFDERTLAGRVPEDRAGLLSTVSGHADGHGDDPHAGLATAEEVEAGRRKGQVRAVVAHRSEVVPEMHFISRWVPSPHTHSLTRRKRSSSGIPVFSFVYSRKVWSP